MQLNLQKDFHFIQSSVSKWFVWLIKFAKYMYSEGPIHSWSSLIQAMAWFQTVDKPLLEPMLTKIYNAIWCY